VAESDGRHESDGGLQRSGQHRQWEENGGTYAVADATRGQCKQRSRTQGDDVQRSTDGCSVVGQADNECTRLEGHTGNVGNGNEPGRIGENETGSIAESCGALLVDHATSSRFKPEIKEPENEAWNETRLRVLGTGSLWSRFEIVQCRDGKARRFESESFEVVDGIPSLMGIDRKEGFVKMEEEIEAYADAQKIRPGEAVSLLWLSLVEKTIQSNFGGSVGFSAPPILLAFLRELANEGWKFSESVLRASAQTTERLLRSLWWEKVSPRPSHRRELEEQQSCEPSDVVCVLSSILARHIQAHWGEAVFAYADDNFPLAPGVSGRVALLRGYGNAIVPPLAAEFIKAFSEIERCFTCVNLG